VLRLLSKERKVGVEEGMTLRTLQAYLYLLDHSPTKLEDVAKALDLKKPGARYHLRKLEELALIRSSGVGGGTVYEVTNAIPLRALQLYRAIMRREIPKYVAICALFLSLFILLIFLHVPPDFPGIFGYATALLAFILFLNELRKCL